MAVTGPLMIVENHRQHCPFFMIIISKQNSLMVLESKFPVCMHNNSNYR